MQNKRLRALTEGAILIALAEILSFLPFYKLPWGGSIDLAMLPIFIFCARWGFGPGMLASISYSILQLLLGIGYLLLKRINILHQGVAAKGKKHSAADGQDKHQAQAKNRQQPVKLTARGGGKVYDIKNPPEGSVITWFADKL